MANQRLKLQAGKMANISQTNQTELLQIVNESAFLRWRYLQQGCIYQWPGKICDMIIFSAQGRGVAICYVFQHLTTIKTV
jgi:hypothetical protein